MRDARSRGWAWLASSALLALVGCASTDLAAIRQPGFQPEADERELWSGSDKLDARLRDRGVLYEDAALQQYLHDVLARLAPALGGAAGPLHVAVLRDPYLNAFALPNGSLYVHSGLLASLDNEAQLATVLGHELAHYTDRHALARQRTAQNKATAMQVVFGVLAVAVAASGDANAVRAMLDLGRQVTPALVETQVNGYARDQERAADTRGFELMTAAGYDPVEAVKVFALLQADATDGGIEEPFYFGSHPRLAERQASYEDLLRQHAAPGGAARRVGQPEFGAAVAALQIDNAKMDLQMGRANRARRTLERHLVVQPRHAEAIFLLGEAHRRGNDLSAARRAFEHAASVDATLAAPHRELGLLLRAAGDQAGARAAFARYVELAPTAVDRGIVEAYIREAEAQP